MNETVLSTLEQKIDPRYTAGVVIDVQNDFCHDEGYLHKLGVDISTTQAMLPALETFIAAARKRKVRIVFVQGIYNNQYLSGPFNGFRSKKGPGRKTVCFLPGPSYPQASRGILFRSNAPSNYGATMPAASIALASALALCVLAKIPQSQAMFPAGAE
jgi:hypothetical protein